MQVNRLLAVALGVALHAIARNFEVDMHAIPLAGLFSLLEMVYFYSIIKIPGVTVYEAVSMGSTQTACLTLSFLTSMLLYRGLFHRLRKFPGPAAARLTKFYAVWKSSLARQYHLELGGLQAKYGDVIRTGPRELTIFRGEAIEPLAACRKSSLYQIEDWHSDRLGLIETRDIEDHRRRRRPWDTALSAKSLSRYDGAMQRTVGNCLDGLASPESEENVINITRWVSLFAWDVMGNVGFGKDFGQVSRGGSEHWAVKALKDQAKFVAYVKPVPWVMNAASNIPYADRAVKPFRDYCNSLVDEKMNTEPDDKEMPSSIISWILREYRKQTPYAPKTRNALNADARTIATAGADTTSNTLTSALFYLARNPSSYARLQSELSEVFPDGPETFSYDVLSKNLSAIPMLDAIINETLRLRPAVPSGNPRVTPPEGLTIPLIDKNGKTKDLCIPGDVDVYVPPYWVHRDPNYFPDPEAFLPGRWLGGTHDKLTTEGSAAEATGEQARSYTIGPREMEHIFPFQVGQYACPGKNLAMWEMRSFLARLALRFDFELAGPSAKDEGAAFEHGMRDTFVITLEPLWMRFKERA